MHPVATQFIGEFGVIIEDGSNTGILDDTDQFRCPCTDLLTRIILEPDLDGGDVAPGKGISQRLDQFGR